MTDDEMLAARSLYDRLLSTSLVGLANLGLGTLYLERQRPEQAEAHLWAALADPATEPDALCALGG